MLRLAKLILGLTVLIPAIGFGADAAVAIGSGDVKLNGRILVRSSVVLPGDELRTEAKSAVVLHANGSTAQAGPSAVFKVRSGGIALESGSVRVRGPINVVAARWIVNADLRSVSYLVTRAEGAIRVTAIKTPVQVQSDQDVVVVEAGETRSFPGSGNAASVSGKSSAKAPAFFVGAAAGAGIASAITSHLEDGGARDISTGTFGR